MGRTRSVIRVAAVGIVLNLVLVGFKMFVGLVSGSISILTDAINNLSDTISSFVTILGVLVGKKKPDKKHPRGHKHFEHISALVIGIIIAITGISLLVESVHKVITPEIATYDVSMLVIIFAGILIKVFLSKYFIKRGKKLRSPSLVASGKDAFFDVIISTGTLVGALITFFFGFTIDGYIGIAISALVIKSAIEISLESIPKIKKYLK